MTPVELALMIFGLMLLLMVVRVPIAAAMFVAGTVGFVVQSGFSPFINFINNLAVSRLANYDLSVIPLFILMGHFATQGGISKAVDWKGGGGFRYYRLAPSLLEKDKWGNWVVSKQYNASMLAEAICKLEGFSYEPSDSLYWQHGHSTERDFIYTTTANLSHDQLQELSDEVGPERSLLVVCSAFRGRKEGYPNLTVKKIPNTVLSRCEWGKDDYSLKVENLPKAPPPAGQQELF
jgi:hypothetical protein